MMYSHDIILLTYFQTKDWGLSGSSLAYFLLAYLAITTDITTPPEISTQA